MIDSFLLDGFNRELKYLVLRYPHHEKYLKSYELTQTAKNECVHLLSTQLESAIDIDELFKDVEYKKAWTKPSGFQIFHTVYNLRNEDEHRMVNIVNERLFNLAEKGNVYLKVVTYTKRSNNLFFIISNKYDKFYIRTIEFGITENGSFDIFASSTKRIALNKELVGDKSIHIRLLSKYDNPEPDRINIEFFNRTSVRYFDESGVHVSYLNNTKKQHAPYYHIELEITPPIDKILQLEGPSFIQIMEKRTKCPHLLPGYWYTHCYFYDVKRKNKHELTEEQYLKQQEVIDYNEEKLLVSLIQ